MGETPVAHWRARPRPDQHQPRRAFEPHHAAVKPPLHPLHAWLFKEAGEPQALRRAVRLSLQLLPRPLGAQENARTGGGTDQQGVDGQRITAGLMSAPLLA